MLSETSPWPPGMRQIKAQPITTVTLSFSLPGAAPHPGPDQRPRPISLSGTPRLAGAVFTVGGLREVRLGHHKARWGRTPEEVTARPDWQLRLRAPGGGVLGFLGAQKFLGLGWPEAGEGKGVFFLFYKKLCSVGISESDP